ncbi:hypothetical protein [Kineococcus sp. SYSU DK002]|uniref:hypothetical protein n=1 Tax=Kineococcus sp. SYSU DK002 TaxID=3383123 RepID=UPI003D7C9749
MQDDADEAPRSAKQWVISGVVAVFGFLVIALTLRIWGSWEDALTWSLVGVIGWIGVDVFSDVRRRRRRRTKGI